MPYRCNVWRLGARIFPENRETTQSNYSIAATATDAQFGDSSGANGLSKNCKGLSNFAALATGLQWIMQTTWGRKGKPKVESFVNFILDKAKSGGPDWPTREIIQITNQLPRPKL